MTDQPNHYPSKSNQHIVMRMTTSYSYPSQSNQSIGSFEKMFELVSLCGGLNPIFGELLMERE